MYLVKISRQAEYDGSLNVTGSFKITDNNNASIFEYKLFGLEINQEGEWHVHSGTSCLNTGDHFMTNGVDLFKDITWNSDHVGYSTKSELINISFTSLEGKVLVIHDSNGVKVACGKIQLAIPGCGDELAVSECINIVEPFDKTKVVISTLNNQLVIKNNNCQGISVAGIYLVLDNIFNNKYLKSYPRYTGFNLEQTNPTIASKTGGECFTPNEGYISSYGKYTYSNFIESSISLMSNVGTNNISLKHGTFIQNISSGFATSTDNIGSIIANISNCPRPASHQLNMCSVTSPGGGGNLPDDEGEFDPLTAVNKYQKIIDSDLTKYSSSIYWFYTASKNGGTIDDKSTINYAWVASAYNIYNFKKIAIDNHNKLSNHKDTVKSNGIVSSITSYRNFNTSRFTKKNVNDITYQYTNPEGYICSSLNVQQPATSLWGILPQQDSVEAYKKNLLDNLKYIITPNTNKLICGVSGVAKWDIHYDIAAANSWTNSVFYIGTKLPSLRQYEEIEKLSHETNYGGRYIQLQWKTAIFHKSHTLELYITRENQYTRINLLPDTSNIDIKGSYMNGLVSYSDSYGNGISDSKPTIFMNIPLFALHRALSMGPSSYIGSEIKQDPQALFKLGKSLNIFHGIFMWTVTDARYWQQPFNLIFTNEHTWISNSPKIITVPDASQNLLTTPIKSNMRLYQWGHYTLRLDDWKHPPSGYILGSGAETIIDGGKTNEKDNNEAFDKKYSVTDPWGGWSSDMSANYFKTFNQGGGGPAPAPTPALTPAPTPPVCAAVKQPECSIIHESSTCSNSYMPVHGLTGTAYANCLWDDTLCNANDKIYCNISTPTLSPIFSQSGGHPVYTGDHYIRLLDENLHAYHTHYFPQAISTTCAEQTTYITSNNELFYGQKYYMIKDTTYLHTDKMAYFAIPKTLNKTVSETIINLNIHEPLLDHNETVLYINLDNLRDTNLSQLIINNATCSINSVYITDTLGILLKQTEATIKLFDGVTLHTIKIAYNEKENYHHFLDQEITLLSSTNNSVNDYYITIHTSEQTIYSSTFHILDRSNIVNIKRPKLATEHNLNSINYLLNNTDKLSDTKIYAITGNNIELISSNKLTTSKYNIFKNLEEHFLQDIINIEYDKSFKSNTTLLHYTTINSVHNIITIQPYNSLFVNSINTFINTSSKFNNIISNYGGTTSTLNNIIYNIIFNESWQSYSGVQDIKNYYSFLQKSNCKIEVHFNIGNTTGTEGIYNYINNDNTSYTITSHI